MTSTPFLRSWIVLAFLIGSGGLAEGAPPRPQDSGPSYSPILSSPKTSSSLPPARHSGIANTATSYNAKPKNNFAEPLRSSVTIVHDRSQEHRTRKAPLPKELLQEQTPLSQRAPVATPRWASHGSPEPNNSSFEENKTKRFAFLPSLPFATLFDKKKAPTDPTETSSGISYRQTIGPLVYHSDFPLSEKETMLEEMEQLHRDMLSYLGIPEPRESIQIFLFRNETGYRKFLEEQFPEAPYRRALYIKKDGPGMVLAHCQKELAVDLRHEMTHALLHASLREIPLWLDEGLAEYFEIAPDERAHRNPYLPSVKWNAKLGMAPDLKRLETLTTLTQMSTREYRDAWSWTHFLLHHSPATHHALARFLKKLSENEATSCHEFLHQRIPEMEKQFLEHFRRWENPKNTQTRLRFF